VLEYLLQSNNNSNNRRLALKVVHLQVHREMINQEEGEESCNLELQQDQDKDKVKGFLHLEW